jgi:L-alanine-DL-glutamate epimerase-like enolase superfamily enzyme
MALIDAVANSIRIPLWRLFGGASDSVTTDITVRLHHLLCSESGKLVQALTRIAACMYLNVDSNRSPK